MKRVVINLSKKRNNLFKLHSIMQKFFSELEFLQDEQRFIQDLLTTFFVDLCCVEMLANTRVLNIRISNLNTECNLLILELQTHEKLLATLLESEHLKGENNFREEHKKMTDKFDQFIQKNRILKNQVFAIIKEIMKMHKQKKLLSPTNLNST